MVDEVTDTWLVGVVAHDEALSSVRVHAGYVAAGPTSGRDHRIQVRLRFGEGSAPAFPDAEASGALIAREDRLVAAFADGAVLVAVLTVPGFRDLVFHTGDPDACRSVVDHLGVEQTDSDEFDVVGDPAWSMYRSLFADAVPADADRRRIHEIAAESGDAAPERTVEHRFSFGNLADADQAAAALRDVGLDVTFTAPDDVADAAPPRFVVTDVEILTQIDMARSRDALSGFATSWGGDYLGWGVVGA